MGDSAIQWTTKVWNPLRGCTEVSPGCASCYAAAIAARFSGLGLPYEGLAYFDGNGKAHWTGKVRTVPEKLAEPMKWRKPQKVFVNSMSDLFHEDVPDEFIDQVFAVMAACPQHTFQVLTKRAERMMEYMTPGFDNREHAVEQALLRLTGGNKFLRSDDWPLPNVWLGVSIEDQKRTDERIPFLLRTPAAIRFLSVEPQLGPINLTQCAPYVLGGDESNPGVMNAFNGLCHHPATVRYGPDPKGSNDGIQWIVQGGESGPNARPFDLAWARSLRDQCKAAGVAYFFKQAGAHPIGSYHERLRMIGEPIEGSDAVVRWKLHDSHGGDLSELPADLRVREFPNAHAGQAVTS